MPEHDLPSISEAIGKAIIAEKGRLRNPNYGVDSQTPAYLHRQVETARNLAREADGNGWHEISLVRYSRKVYDDAQTQRILAELDLMAQQKTMSGERLRRVGISSDLLERVKVDLLDVPPQTV